MKWGQRKDKLKWKDYKKEYNTLKRKYEDNHKYNKEMKYLSKKMTQEENRAIKKHPTRDVVHYVSKKYWEMADRYNDLENRRDKQTDTMANKALVKKYGKEKINKMYKRQNAKSFAIGATATAAALAALYAKKTRNWK